MIYSLDYLKRLEKPFVYLADPNKTHIGTIQAKELQSDMCFNNISTVTFKVYKYEDGIETTNYESIEMLRLVEITYLGWFQITKADKYGNGTKYEYKEIEVASLENEATSKALTSFGQLGTDDDEQGGLDRYRLYNIADPEHSILHIWQKKLPSWSIGYVDPAITQEYRTFTNDEVGAYSFLVEDVSKTFECIFQFDTYNQTVNAYKLENIGQVTSIYLSYRNLVKSVKISADFSDIKTAYTVAGGDDNGSTLGIIEVNPSGNNQITNFSYYKPWMSQALQTRLDQYQAEYDNRQTVFNNAITTLQSYYGQLNDLYNKLPSDLNSTNWPEYGLDELTVKYDVYNNNMALYVGTNNSNYSINYNLREAVNSEITIRKNQIYAKETQIENQYAICKSLLLNIQDYLGNDLFKELSRYYHEDTFTDDTFVATSEMTVSEILQMKKNLLELAQSDLAKRCKPQYQIEVDAVNFTAIPEFKEYADQLELGNIITLDFGDEVLVESRLLKIHMNWNNPGDFSLTFSSKNRLDGVFEQLAEIQSQANGASTAFNISGTGWNTAKNKTSAFSEYMSSTLNLSNQKLKNSNNETFVADSTGTKWRKLIDGTSNYSPNQMWGVGNGLYLTQNNWQTVSMAIGEGNYNGQTMYGIWAPLICGDLILGQNLAILNSSGNFTISNTGFKATYGDNTVTINPNDSNNIFSISVGGTKKLYVDVISNRLVFNGTLEGANGTFSGTLQAATGTFSGTVSASTIAAMNLEVGQNVRMGPNVTISWGQVSGAPAPYSDAQALWAWKTSGYGTWIDDKGIYSGIVRADRIIGDTITGLKIYSKFINGSDSVTLQMSDVAFSVEVNASGVTAYSSLDHNSLQFNSPSLYATYGKTGINIRNYSLESSNVFSVDSSGNVSIKGAAPITTSTKNSFTYPPSSHTHSSLNIIPAETGGGNIAMSGLNAASVNWCNTTFQPKSSSDFRLKKNIRSLEELPIELFMELKPKMYEFKCSGYGDGVHFGFLAQELESAFEKYGLNALDYNIVEIVDKRNYLDEGQYLLDGKIHRINYENFYAWEVMIIQKIYRKVFDNQSKNLV